MKQTPEAVRAQAAKRQADRVEREKAAGRTRRGYYATPGEHTALAAHLTALRSTARIGDVLVAAPGDVLPEFRAGDTPPSAEQDPDGYTIGENYEAGLWSRRNIEAFIADGNTVGAVCAHSYHYFGSQKRRRCNYCSQFEPEGEPK